MRRLILLGAVLIGLAGVASATVIINEFLVNPAGSGADDTREFIELLGTPGMKLDGYAIAFVNGTQVKFYPLGSIPPVPAVHPEVDEFFSLDGLSLGPNGLLLLGIGGSYPTLLPDTNFQQWNTLWNGGLDTTGKLQNDGSNTIFLIRNRPGATQAEPSSDRRWAKDVNPDYELITPVTDPQDGIDKDQLGDGNLDKGQLSGGLPNDPPRNFSTTHDMKGASTPLDISDDLEIVDEVSYEHDRGWEYDQDDRNVDLGSALPGWPERDVHKLDDPQGFNPDALTRVDYRTKGEGWAPVPGATGELPNGNNWQDTASEQWVRGETVIGTGGAGSAPQFFYRNTDVDDPNIIVTNVPSWLNDGIGSDYSFASLYTYQVMPGRINPLATPYIPGDTDRDGDCDIDDVAKLAAVFGDDNWVFSNSYNEAPEGDDGDPATQTRPWDVDLTGDNGIEASDLQWVLNFLLNTNGQIVGRTYDSTTPAATGVVLNPNTGVLCTISIIATTPSGHALNALVAGEAVDVVVRGQVTAGANNTSGQQNGIMQFVHDLHLSPAGIARVGGSNPLGVFVTTRAAIRTPLGTEGDAGVANLNGYTISFTQGVTAATDLYRARLRVLTAGTTTLTLAPASELKFAASTPAGLKLGHTNSNGNPQSAAYPAPVVLTVTGVLNTGDMNCNGSIGFEDINPFVVALVSGPAAYLSANPGCNYFNGDINGDGEVSFSDINPFVSLLLVP